MTLIAKGFIDSHTLQADLAHVRASNPTASILYY